MHQASSGYDDAADDFIRARSQTIGLGVIDAFAKRLPQGASVLELGAGFGLPVTLRLKRSGFEVFAIESSPSLYARLNINLPGIHAQCEDALKSDFFDRTFEAVIFVGLIFLLPPEDQKTLITKTAKAIKRGGFLLFSAPLKPCLWTDTLTHQPSQSLGLDAYRDSLKTQGLELIDTPKDEGGNEYVMAVKKPQ
jgi:SAM-dependent methyltransferase